VSTTDPAARAGATGSAGSARHDGQRPVIHAKIRAMQILIRILINAVALGVAAWVVDGIDLTGDSTTV